MKFSAIITLSSAALVNFVAAAPTSHVSNSLDARYLKGGAICGLVEGSNVNPANKLAGENIPFIRNHGGNCGANAHACSRLSCSYDSSIWLCNDSNAFLSITCSRVADIAKTILDACQPSGVQGWKGQRFDTNNYNVVIRGDTC